MLGYLVAYKQIKPDPKLLQAWVYFFGHFPVTDQIFLMTEKY